MLLQQCLQEGTVELNEDLAGRTGSVREVRDRLAPRGVLITHHAPRAVAGHVFHLTD